MGGGEERPLFLDYRLESSLLELPVYSPGTDGSADHILQRFGNLGSIICLSRGDELDSIVDIEG